MIRNDTWKSSKTYKYMSSNMHILKVCEYCKKDFIAKKTTSACCSDNCAKRLYKDRKRDEKIKLVEVETKSKKILSAGIVEDEFKIINAKQYLTLIEAALLLNVSPLTLRRWTLAKQIAASKSGKKWIFDKTLIMPHKRF